MRQYTYGYFKQKYCGELLEMHVPGFVIFNAFLGGMPPDPSGVLLTSLITSSFITSWGFGGEVVSALACLSPLKPVFH
jgi:hypothetical protein